MTDLISRADAIEAIKKEIQDFEANYMHGEDDEDYGHDIGFVAGLHRAKTLIKALPSADAVPQLRQTDTLIIADALRYLAKDTEQHLVDRTRADALRQQFLKYGASMCKGGDDE